MRNIPLYIFSSAAILILVLLMGWRVSSSWQSQQRRELNQSLEQESLTLMGATKAAIESLSFQLLDVLKVEGQNRTTRTFEQSPFLGVALLERAGDDWKADWSRARTQGLKKANWLKQVRKWDLESIEPSERQIRKLGNFDGHPYFAFLVPVRKPGATPYMGVGIMMATAFPLRFSSMHQRQTLVFDDEGYALAYSQPAYLGTSVKKLRGVIRALTDSELSVQESWESANGELGITMIRRIPETNLFVSVEGTPAGSVSFVWSIWIYLGLLSIGAICLNWWLFSRMVKPLFRQIHLSEDAIEHLKKTLENASAPGPQGPVMVPDTPHRMRVLDMKENVHTLEFIEVPGGTLRQLIKVALRSMEERIQESGISVHADGVLDVSLKGEALQLQTAIEEVLKNAVESMANTRAKRLDIRAFMRGSNLTLEILDTGHGVEAENLSKVFDPFFSTKDSEGVARGLGLNVVRRVMEEMHGRVEIQPREDSSGTLVTMSWPLTEVPEPRDESAPDPVATPSVAPIIRKPVVRTLD